MARDRGGGSMKVRLDVAQLIREDHSDREIARRLHVRSSIVRETRQALGLPPRPVGIKAADSVEELFHQRTTPVDGGHLEWTGYRTFKGTPTVRWNQRPFSAYRVAFGIRHGRPPVGQVRPGCGYPHCVAPDHVEDQQMRDQLKTQMTAIFGGAA
ncbi:hypothetical protein ACFVDT_07160 [Streptomyces sp. NPDC057699]|uniref:hypothetical protein n=1 Tax=Streptomyces sp. NPDC057699 TaxID=3346220 RepID=UPI0036AA69E9